MSSPQQLTPRGALLMGALFIASGVFPILIGFGVVTPAPRATPPPPAWVAIAVGLMFVFAGLALILDFAIANGVGADGDLAPGTPLLVRGANFTLGAAIVALMTAVTGWIAFGPGPRQFSTSFTLPFVSRQWQSGDLGGRIAFGFATVLLAVMFVACGTAGFRRLVRAWRSGQPPARL
jgi:hypothetical protein